MPKRLHGCFTPLLAAAAPTVALSPTAITVPAATGITPAFALAVPNVPTSGVAVSPRAPSAATSTADPATPVPTGPVAPAPPSTPPPASALFHRHGNKLHTECRADVMVDCRSTSSRGQR